MKLNLPSKGSSIVRGVIFAIEIFLLWLVIMAQEFAFNRFSGNEVDVLPVARQIINSGWLPNDWYLNLDFGYRELFSYFVGFLVDRLGFLHGAYAGRVLAYLMLALALVVFFRAINLRFTLGFILLVFYLENQSLIAGEWIVGGVDTKTFAYSFALLSFSAILKKRYLLGFAFAGAALSFHVLVGIYALFCTGFAMLLTVKSWRGEGRTLLRQSWPFLISGAFGLLAIIQQLLPQGEIDVNKAWEIYVGLRVPHHVLPSFWGDDPWLINLALATCLFIAIYLLRKSVEARFTAAYALGSVCLFALGLAIYAIGETNLLRFYWFRYPDVMVPFLGMVMVALMVSDLTHVYFEGSPHFRKHWNSVQDLLSRGLPMFLTLAVILLSWQSITVLRTVHRRGLRNRPPRISTSLEWIRNNTPGKAMFLVAPSVTEFYIYAERAEFVSFNHAPQFAADILEWHERIVLGNDGYPLKAPVSKNQLRNNFYRLDEGSIRDIAEEFGLSYYLGLADSQLPLEPVYQDDNFILFEID